MVRRIVACGGQQLLYPALVRYVLGLARRPRPRVLFLGTASGDGAGYLLTFYQALAGVDCEPSHLALFDRTVDDIDAFVRSQDVVIVGGGNTANMLAIWRLHGVESALRNAYAEGTVLSGWSAGCLCWFEGGVTDCRRASRSRTALPLVTTTSGWSRSSARALMDARSLSTREVSGRWACGRSRRAW